jgi:chondroitin AC lyase
MHGYFFKSVFTALFLVTILLTGKSQEKSAYPEALIQLHQNIWNDILSGTTDKENVDKICGRLTAKGEWPDIDYSSKQRGDWPPSSHLGRLQTMAKAYQKQGSACYHDPALLAKIDLALNYWLTNDFQCPNWWYPEIGVPMSLAPTLLLLETELSKDEMASGIKILDRAKIRMTGQNKVWLSGNVLLKSLLLRDTATIRKASASIQEELKVSLEEGIQPDGSFHQHGPQIQFGNYGLSYVSDMIKWVRILRKTPFCFDENKLAILRNYLFDGQQWIIWKNQMDISACGRQLFVDAQLGKARSLSNSFRQMELLDPAFSDGYKKSAQYEKLSGNKHFWNSDFQIQRSPDYYFSVKMCSERVIGAESCNSENIRGYYLGDGATYLYQSGKEYENIFPYWDWKKIPGTTTLQDDKELPVLTASGYRIQSSFVGGVSDGKNGVAVMDYLRNGITAKKAWFNFNNLVVCLGSGVSSSGTFAVATTVNQSFLNGPVVVKEKSEKTIAPASEVTLNPAWILHDHIGYFFPEGGNLRLETKVVSGSWNQVALMYKNESIQSAIFKLWFNHGANTSNQNYAYIIVPQATKSVLQKMEIHPSVKILKNEPDVQAVISSDSSMGGVVFYKAGKTDLFGGIEVSQPCVLMIKKGKGMLNISLSDPTHKLDQITLNLNGKFKLDQPMTEMTAANGKSILKVNLPQKGEAGKTVNLSLKTL